jgi:hypothetical protein
LFSLTEFGAGARKYPVACGGVRQRNFDFLDLAGDFFPWLIFVYFSVVLKLFSG